MRNLSLIPHFQFLIFIAFPPKIHNNHEDSLPPVDDIENL
jgi:hypothetical protein